MSDDLTALGSFDGIARLFPLPNVVLFPQVMLPLHIFEPRYRQLTADALAGDRLIGMVLLRPGWESDYEGRPALYETACLGRILAEQRLDDGRFNILLRGISRVRLIAELEHDKLYRSARVELLRDQNAPIESIAAPLRRQLGQRVKRWFQAMGVGAEQLQKLLESDLTLGPLTDVLSFALPLSVELKQSLLDELAVEPRAHRLIEHLETSDPPKTATSAGRAFPPEFSSN
jgi:Lon protease-like protein